MRVSVIELSTGRTLTGEDAPMMSQLAAFMETHPGWEMIETESDEDSEDEGEEDGDKDKKREFFFVKVSHSDFQVFFIKVV